MAMAMKPDRNSRFTDLSDEPVDHLLSPIKGYLDKPLVSLAEAIQPISNFFNEIEDNVYVALHNCQNSADGLDQQESASIHLYTMQFDGGPSLYVLLNRSLRAENREELKPWFFFLKLFLTALHKLPSQSTIVWRGVRDVNLSSKYKTGTKFAWWGVSSCTTHIEVLESNEFLGKTGERTLFSIECINGKSVANHSYFKNTEKEIILMPGSYFEVMGQLNPAPQLYIIQLKEISPPITLVKPPFSKSNNITSSSSVIDKSNPVSPPLSSKIKQHETSNIAHKDIPLKLKKQEFAAPGTKNYKKLDCEGRPCANCGKCRDWHFTGDRATWRWIQGYKNWQQKDKDRWYGGVYKLFKKRDGATCFLHYLLGYGVGVGGCLCDDNAQF